MLFLTKYSHHSKKKYIGRHVSLIYFLFCRPSLRSKTLTTILFSRAGNRSEFPGSIRFRFIRSRSDSIHDSIRYRSIYRHNANKYCPIDKTAPCVCDCICVRVRGTQREKSQESSIYFRQKSKYYLKFK